MDSKVMVIGEGPEALSLAAHDETALHDELLQQRYRNRSLEAERAALNTWLEEADAEIKSKDALITQLSMQQRQQEKHLSAKQMETAELEEELTDLRGEVEQLRRRIQEQERQRALYETTDDEDEDRDGSDSVAFHDLSDLAPSDLEVEIQLQDGFSSDPDSLPVLSNGGSAASLVSQYGGDSTAALKTQLEELRSLLQQKEQTIVDLADQVAFSARESALSRSKSRSSSGTSSPSPDQVAQTSTLKRMVVPEMSLEAELSLSLADELQQLSCTETPQKPPLLKEASQEGSTLSITTSDNDVAEAEASATEEGEQEAEKEQQASGARKIGDDEEFYDAEGGMNVVHVSCASVLRYLRQVDEATAKEIEAAVLSNVKDESRRDALLQLRECLFELETNNLLFPKIVGTRLVFVARKALT
eukprot:m.364927 g.364927  ORF g.364927 m.364927 type:complete len:418 (+) comp29105_c0_seq1:234-1487(+)